MKRHKLYSWFYILPPVLTLKSKLKIASYSHELYPEK